MRTTFAVVLVLCIGTAGLMWQMAGISSVFTADDPVDDLESTDEVEERGGDLEDETNQNNDGGFFSVVRDRAEDSLVGAIVSGAGQIVGFVKLALLLPLELQRLGFPRWLSLPAGLALQALTFVGFVQFITGRDYR